MPGLSGFLELLFFQIPVGLLALSFLVFIHEGGHFLAAKWAGVQVHVFSIGFGKKLLRWRRGETEYCISAIPFGGYVAMAGEQPVGEGSEERMKPQGPRDFVAKSVPARMWIAFAGPFVNIMFSFLILVFLFMIGVNEEVSSMQVGAVEEGSAAEMAGVQVGDEIIALGDRKIERWESFLQDVALNGARETQLIVRREGQRISLPITPQLHEKLEIATVGISGQDEVYVGRLFEGRPAIAAGVKQGDIIKKVNGVDVPSPLTLVNLINQSEGAEIELTVLREETLVPIRVTPTKDEQSGRFIIGLVPEIPKVFVRRGLLGSIQKSWEQNLEYASLMVRTIRGIFAGIIQLKTLSGPVGITQVVASSLEVGVPKFVEILALISLNLGLINLLPLAITDGGLILFLALEGIRRKPLKIKTQMTINKVAISLFIVLFLFVTFHDIQRIPWFLN